MWGGRFASGPAEIMEEINASIGFDKHLAPQDIRGSLAHVAMLGAAGILPPDDVSAIQDGLKAVQAEIEAGQFEFKRELEDIHMSVESRLREIVGPTAGRLHTARSRNDQVATDMKLWVRDTLDSLDAQAAELQRALAEKALAQADTVMPGFTHLQSAQPVTFGHHCLAYVEMLGRDRGRFRDARARLNECPLGAAALAGTSFPIDRHATAAALGFDRPTANSLDSVADRDFALESLSAASICAVHLSRFAEDLVVWTSAQFGFVRLSDGFTTGSSIMPQKRNPDVAELARGKSGRVVGHLMGLLTLMKGQPLTYNKDNQEDKEPLFDTVDTVRDTLRIMAEMVGGITVKKDAMERAALKGHATATDLADYLAKKGLPFRDAHEVVAHAVKQAIQQGVDLSALPLATLQGFHASIGQDVFEVLSLRGSLNARNVLGGTAPEQVRMQLARHRARLS